MERGRPRPQMKSVLLKYVAGAAALCGFAALVLSIAVLAIALAVPGTGYPVFDPLSALWLALLAGSTLLARIQSLRRAGRLLGGLVGLGGLVTLAVDAGEFGGVAATAVTLLCFGASSLLFLKLRYGLGQAAIALALLPSLSSAMSHLLGTEVMFGRLPALMLLATILCGAAMAGGTAHRGAIRVFLSKTISGRFARQQMLIATFAPAALALFYASLLVEGSLPLALAETVASIIVIAWITIGATALVGRRLDIQRHRAEAELRNLARYDALTGLLNRRSMNSALPVRHAEASRNARPITLMMCDLDHFKRLNDEHGHAVGDEVLRRTAQRISSAVRDSDLVFRYGGEEISVLLDCGSGDAVRIADKIRDAVKAPTRRAGDTDLPPVTISIGAATSTRAATEMKNILEAADECLYAAKDAGRDCVRHVSLP
jgi:diguanylate cyclase (GGDEF)-like protein